MAHTTTNLLLHQLKGKIGKQLVIKRYGNKTVVTAYPDMSGIKPSALQKNKRNLFAEAVAYAQEILRNPAQKAIYQQQLKKDGSVYHAAIKAYMKQNSNADDVG